MITLPSVFGDGMVLAKSAKIWGKSEPNHLISANFLGKNYETATDNSGRFEFSFAAEEFGGPHTLTIEDKKISDVYIGRVWFCGGQSNMEGPLSRTRLSLGEFVVNDARIRIFQAEKGLNFQYPQEDVNGSWNSAEGDFLDDMYAVPYFFARNLIESGCIEDGVKIGLVCAPAGGTPIEGWLPEKSVRGYSDIYERLIAVKEPGYVERATEESEKKVNAWHTELSQKDAGIHENWHAKDYDDSHWQTRALLDPTGSPSHGAIWLRRKFFLPKIDGCATLNFGRIESNVVVYINGAEIFNVPYKYPPCVCEIPAGVLIEGENTIALRIVGDESRPLIVPGKDYEIFFDGGRVNFIPGKWKWRVGAEMKKCPVGVWFYSNPCGVHNYMLAPLLGLSVEGLIWYQGESNSGYPHSYKALFTEFIKYFRQNFGENMPVIFTQLANYIDPGSYHLVGGFGAPGGYWAILREQQRQCLQIPNTAMAVAIDCGEYNDLHPADKKSVGDRLALHARRMVYGEDIVSDGPIVEKIVYDEKEQKIAVHFKHGEGLWAKDGHPLLSILYKDGNVHHIFAAIRDDKMVAPVGTLTPRAVRFGWADCPTVPVYNAYGLPASPFEEIIKDSRGGRGVQF